MNIQQFQYVLAVVDFKNFEDAAEKCHVTQSTLSTMIGKLEKELDIKIFNRKTKPVTITPEGQQLIDRFRIITNELDILDNLTQELKGEMVGELRIAIIPTITPYLLPLFLSKFTNKFPKVTLIVKEMTTSEITHALKIRSIDIGILALPINERELSEIELFSEPFLIYDCTEENNQTKIPISDLDYSKLFLLSDGHCLRTQVQKVCELSTKHATKDFNFEFESGSMDSLLRVTKNRKGITIIPYLASIDLPEEESDKIMRFEPPIPVRQVGLVTHNFFVKKKLLKSLKSIISEATDDLIPRLKDEKQIMNPL